ncbi:MAG: TetR/AcrR family transcriptional regulator [Psychromonas sp.]|nr:TetR/AcrR family transcriptional regulator [Psychromonas sp.]
MTKQRLISAAGEILATEGFTKFGINAVARQAGVNKALIYRYFGDLDGLVTAYAGESDFWPTTDELLENLQDRPLNMQQYIQQILANYWYALDSRPQTLAVMAWELVDRNQLTIILEQHREKSSVLLGKQLHQQLTKIDSSTEEHIRQKLPNIMAITSASVNYLLLRKREVHYFAGVDLHSQEEITQMLTEMAQMIVNSINCN